MRPFRHVGINAVFLRPMMGGIDTYVRRLVPALLELEPDLRLTVFVSRAGRDLLAGEAWTSQAELVTHPLLGIRYLQAASEMLLLGRLASARGVDVLQSVALTGPLGGRAAHVLTLADLTWLREPAAIDAVTGWTWRTFVPRIANRADRILTASEATKRDIVELLALPAGNIDVVPHGPGTAELVQPRPEAALRAAFDIPDGPVVLTASVKRPTKNLRRLIEAWRLVLARVPDATLVLAGTPTPHEEELKAQVTELGLAERVRFPGYVDAVDLEGLYRCAACFVFPSLYEGFGLPVLEAMRRNVPVACSRASSLPEVAGDAARYFDPTSTEDMAQAVIDLLTDKTLAASLAAAGQQRQRQFTWRRAGEGTLDCFERAWNRRKTRDRR
jgi:glycosyltransferase involved in cell wall biosynthesis